jgi:hypothetical protein
MRTIVYSASLIASVLTGINASAESLHSVRLLAGYECKMLKLTEDQSLSQSTRIPVRIEPSPDAQIVGIASGQMAVRQDAEPTNGFLEAINLSGRKVWVAADALTDYHSRSDPNATCKPAIMSNGRIGFEYAHPHTAAIN